MSRSRARDTVMNEGTRSDANALGADSAGVRWAFASALSVFLVYLLTLPPTVTGEDSGERIAAAYTLGVAHPPGYPIWCIIAHLFTYIPLYSVAWRVALMSAVFGAATVFLLCLVLAERKKKEGFEALDLAADVMGDEKSTFNNFGSTAIELGYRDEGAKYYMRALAIDPNYVLARRNVAKLYYREGDYANALKQFKSIADADPRDPDIYFDVVDCLTKLKRTSDALSVLRAVEGRFGKHSRVYREMGYVYLNENYDQQTAKYYFTQSLLLNQNQADLQAFVGRTPTADDLQKYYPPGVEIPEEFKKPDPLNPNLPKSPIPGVELPKPPADESSEPLPAFPMPDIGAPGGEVPPTPTPGVPMPEVPTPGLPATGLPSTGIPVPPIGGPPVPNAPPVPAGVPQL